MVYPRGYTLPPGVKILFKKDKVAWLQQLKFLIKRFGDFIHFIYGKFETTLPQSPPPDGWDPGGGILPPKVGGRGDGPQGSKFCLETSFRIQFTKSITYLHIGVPSRSTPDTPIPGAEFWPSPTGPTPKYLLFGRGGVDWSQICD